MLLKLKEANIEIKKSKHCKKEKKHGSLVEGRPVGYLSALTRIWTIGSTEKKKSTVLLNIKITLASEICASIPHENLEWNGYVL